MIPLVLVTGFLGAGKTTLLQNVAAAPGGRELVFLVNEFADLNIDARRLEGLAPKVFEVTGGSLFCECKVTDFIENLETIHGFLANNQRRLKGVVIETSGIADPEVMAKLLRETGFADKFRIARIIALVAPYRFAAYLAAYPNLEAQIRTSDLVVLNKTDTADEVELAAVEALIQKIKSGVPIVRTAFAQLDLDLWTGKNDYAETGQLSVCANPYACITVHPPASTTPASIETLCTENADRILRAKGIVHTANGFDQIDFANGAFSRRPVQASKEKDHLVLIVPEEAEAWALARKAEIEALP